MTSLQTSFRQVPVNAPNFVVLTNNTTSGDRLKFTLDANNVTGKFEADTNIADANVTAGTLLRDMGSVIVSSGLTFRRVQYVLPGSANTDIGVNPNGPTSGLTNGVYYSPVISPLTGYLTFYVQLGKNGGTPGLNLARV